VPAPSGRDLALQSQPQSLSARFGKDGRVLVQDILPEVRNQLADLKLPENSFDRVLMIHMYHGIETLMNFSDGCAMFVAPHHNSPGVITITRRSAGRHAK
jgi:hypothetical protein